MTKKPPLCDICTHQNVCMFRAEYMRCYEEVMEAATPSTRSFIVMSSPTCTFYDYDKEEQFMEDPEMKQAEDFLTTKFSRIEAPTVPFCPSVINPEDMCRYTSTKPPSDCCNN